MTLFESVLSLAAMSDIHKGKRLDESLVQFGVPFQTGQFVVVMDEKVVAFASFALLSDDAEQVVIKRVRPLFKDDFKSGDNIWLLDAIAPFGHASTLTSALRKHLVSLGYRGRYIKFRRTYPDGRSRISRAMI